MKKIIAFASLFIICYFTGVSQPNQDQGKDRFVPSSPTVAELGKYGSIPVSHYTGVPNISIPLYTLQCGQLSLPITLTYHAGGIRVDQIASWVGLGWSLNAGGIINSSAMGIPDINTAARLDASSFWDYDTFPTLSNAGNIANGYMDSQPDIYNYNFLNHSGQFIQDADGQIYDMKSNKQIKIARIGNILKITDTNGTVYEFGGGDVVERTTRDNYIGGYAIQLNQLYMNPITTSNVTSAWFLTSITSADGIDKLTFEYEQETQQYNTPLQGKISYDFAYNNKAGRWVGSDEEWGHTLNIGAPFSYSQITNQTWRLTCIMAKSNNHPLATLRFIASERSDFNGGKKLARIDLEETTGNGSNGNYGNIIKQWIFNYGYFGAYYQNVLTDPYHRLKLTSVVEDGQVTTGRKVHSFNYYGEGTGEPKMPRRLSYCGYDYWGYANASAVTVSEQDAINVKKLFPNNLSYSFTGSQTRQQCYWNSSAVPCPEKPVNDTSPRTVSFPEGSNKAPDEYYAKTYSLKELHYPTGGYSRFDYEANDFTFSEDPDSIQVCGGLRIKSIEDYDDNGELKGRKSYRYGLSCFWEPHRVLSSGSLINFFRPLQERLSKFYPESSGSCRGLLILNQNTVDLSSSSHSSMYSAYGGEYIGYSEVEEFDGNGFKRYKFYSASNFPAHSQSRSKMAWYNALSVPEEDRIDRNKSASSYYFLEERRGLSCARGLVRSIDVFDTSGRIVSSESYAYNFENTHKVYGMEVMRYPDNDEYFGACHPRYATSSGSYHNPMVNGHEFAPMGYCFNVYYHQTGQALLASKELKLYDNTADCNCTFPSDGMEYEYQFPVDYLDDYKSYIATWETYEYNAYNQRSRMNTWRSDQRVETTFYKYPSDMINNPDECLQNPNGCNMAVMQGMDAKFISPVIRTEKRVNNNIVYVDYKQYNKVSATNTDMYRPEKVFQMQMESPVETKYPSFVRNYSALMKERTRYTKYNEYGKVSSLIADDQTPVVYLWSYTGQYPVAEIKNATYEEVRDALGGETAVTNLANTIYPNHTIINNLRTNPAFAKAQISTYTYKPLLGMLTATDPRGVTTYYQYDGTGKLIRSYIIENYVTKTIEQYDYHYKN